MVKQSCQHHLSRRLLVTPLAFITLLFSISVLSANSGILTFEAQGVGNYSGDEWNWYSHHLHDAMQKPSIGFDWLHRAGSGTRDWGYLSLQSRLAYDESAPDKLRLQVYNAFLNYKSTYFDAWAGHNKTALGVNSYFDNHALLMPDNTMSGLNYDRDWGIGLKLNRQMPEVNLSFSTGSGMPLYIGDNYLLAGRIAYGDFAKDDLSLGLSAGTGKTLHSMGYIVMHNKQPLNYETVGIDFAKRHYNWVLMTDTLYGKYNNKSAYSSLFRLSGSFLQEERLMAEAQVNYARLLGKSTRTFSTGLSYKLNADISLRGLYEFEDVNNTHKTILQVYYQKALAY